MDWFRVWLNCGLGRSMNVSPREYGCDTDRKIDRDSERELKAQRATIRVIWSMSKRNHTWIMFWSKRKIAIGFTHQKLYTFDCKYLRTKIRQDIMEIKIVEFQWHGALFWKHSFLFAWAWINYYGLFKFWIDLVMMTKPTNEFLWPLWRIAKS